MVKFVCGHSITLPAWVLSRCKQLCAAVMAMILVKPAIKFDSPDWPPNSDL